MSETHGKKKALGRGLSALLDTSGSDSPQVNLPDEYISGSFRQVRIDQIEANPFQPRTHFNENELRELADSIREHGIIQPLTIRKIDSNKYQLISGERRLRASQLAGLTEVPAYIRVANDEQMLEMALVENIQREDLNPIEIAISFQRLLEECRIKQEDLSHKVGKDRTTISNYIRLLKLPNEIQVAVRDNLISNGHARAMINLNDEKAQLVVLKNILEKKSSVRQVEEMVRNIAVEVEKKVVVVVPQNVHIQEKFEKARLALLGKLQSGVELKVNRNGAGKIIISFNSDEDFERIISKFNS
ncbi:MAG: ParB/RepB/Spo0J family partition protein [Bacteroidetes bacterium]|nr:ParB/RepB/Spo0J family partition protein [Bacteroidota bacterium]